MPPVLSPSAALSGAGLRVTAPRVAVLQILQEHPHADAADLVQLTRHHARGISVQGVYDVLNRLTDAGLIRRIQPAHSVARYELDHGDNHHHVVCRGCGSLVDVPCTTGAAPCLDAGPARSLGYHVDEAEVIYWGLCPQCHTSDDEPHIPTPKEKS